MEKRRIYIRIKYMLTKVDEWAPRLAEQHKALGVNCSDFLIMIQYGFMSLVCLKSSIFIIPNNI